MSTSARGSSRPHAASRVPACATARGARNRGRLWCRHSEAAGRDIMEQEELESLVTGLVEKQEKLDAVLASKDEEIESLKESNRELMGRLMVRIDGSRLPDKQLSYEEVYDQATTEIADAIRERFLNKGD